MFIIINYYGTHVILGGEAFDIIAQRNCTVFFIFLSRFMPSTENMLSYEIYFPSKVPEAGGYPRRKSFTSQWLTSKT